jgi:hypothetical protein
MVEWADRLYSEGVDRKDAAVFANAFAADGWVRFGNSEPLAGRDAIRDGIAGFFQMFAALSHESTYTTWADRTLVLEARVTYTLHLGGTVTVPACTVYLMGERENGEPKAKECRIYVDLSPLFAAVQTPVS